MMNDETGIKAETIQQGTLGLSFNPEMDDWECDMFGLDGTFRLRPLKGKTPNWFWRWMQFLLVGNRWRKIP